MIARKQRRAVLSRGVSGTQSWRAVFGALGAAVALLLSILAAPAGSTNHEQGVGLAVRPLFPPSVTVGDEDVPAQLAIANNSTGVGPVTLGQIILNPSCGDPSPTPCQLPDPGVFDLSATAAGVGGACTNVSFTITGPEANGQYQFVPAEPVVLQPPGNANSNCFIAFTLDVVKAPTMDANSSAAGLQTRQFAAVTGSGTAVINDQPTTMSGTGTGTSITTVAQATPQINTMATPNATLGQPVSDTATVIGPTGAPVPTGSVTFTLFGPDNPTCAGSPVYTSTAPLNPGPAGGANDSVANSNPFTPTQPGTYNWVAVYSGDANYTTATSPCGAANESSVVTRPVATITTVATTSTRIGGTISDTATVTGPAIHRGPPAPSHSPSSDPTIRPAPAPRSSRRPTAL